MNEQQDKSPFGFENDASIRRITQQFMRGEISEEEYERRMAKIRTEGGAVVEGDVSAGTFIGRDQIIVISGYTGQQLEQVLDRLREILASGQADLCADVARGRLAVAAPDAPHIVLSSEAARDLLPVAARQADERSYLAALLVNPRYGRWATQFVPLAGTLTTFERPPGWADVPPEFTLLEMSGEGPGRQVRRVHLEDITQATAQHQALVLLGEPGAGKTTTLYKLALDAARQRLTGGGGKFPLYLSLADYRDYSSPYAFVEAVWRQLLGGNDLAARLRRGDLLLLCDALNEMPFHDDRGYRGRVGAWRRFVGDWPGNQVLFTCRSRDYGEPLGLHQVEIERLDDGRIQTFLEKYLPPDLVQESWIRLAGSPLLELVRNPYYLSMLAYILARGGEWPAGRAGMLEDFVDLLLTREKTRGHPDWPGENILRQALSALAERIQPMGEGTRLPRQETLVRIPGQVAGPDGLVEVPPPTILRLGLAASLLDTELPPDGEEHVRFYHHQLQEYFAARALLARFRAGESLAERWQQPRLEREMPDPGPLGDFEPLPPPPPTGWEEPTILAGGLATDPAPFIEAVRGANPTLAARCLAEAGVGAGLVPDQVVQSVQADLLREIGDQRVHLRARIAAGEALGWLEDPRFQAIEVPGGRALLPPLVAIPAGPFRMGSGRWHVLRLRLQGLTWAQDEQPRHTVDLPAYHIGQFPVTNAEYACFIAAGGYQEERYWLTEAARAWLRGEATEGGPLKEAMDLWRAIKEDPGLLDQLRRAGGTPQQLAAWEQLARMEEGEAREVLGKVYTDRPRDRPAFWDDERYNHPGGPVVGVTWYEAQAYCGWLTEQFRVLSSEFRVSSFELRVWRDGQLGTRNLELETCRVRLPTEAEWEKAARMDRGWIYPWGNRWDPNRANTWEGHALRPAPVGVYPGGVTPEGIHELAGGVWEWTTSQYRPYPYRADDGREELEAEGRRVLRGGAWYDARRLARCACRYWLNPVLYRSGGGFRLVVSLALPSSDS
jgi:formylglycine-generating enzyme required for sulfatase activity